MTAVTQIPAEDAGVLDRLTARDGADARVLIRGASVVSMDAEVGDLARGDILVAGGRIEAVGDDLSAAAADGQAIAFDATGTIAIPGLQDTHRHSWQAQMRRLRPDGDLGGYIELLHFRIGPAYRPEDVYVGNLLAAAGALDAGVTCMLDFSHLTLAPAYSDAAIRGLREAGIRGVFVSAPPVSGDGMAWHSDLRRLRAEQLPSDDDLVTMRMGMYSTIGEIVQPPKGLSPENLRLARELGVDVTVDAVFGANAGAEIEALSAAGELHDDMTFIHCQSIGEAAWRAIASSGASVALAVTSDALLGCEEAVPPIQQAIEHGIAPGLSVDVECCLTSDMFSQMQATLTIQRMLAYQRRHLHGTPADEPPLLRARDVLEYATIAGARANGVARVAGSLTPGKAADIVLVRADDIGSMPLNNAVATVVLGADTRSVDTVLVQGRPRKWRGRLVDIDRDALLRKVIASRDAVLERAGYDLDVTL
jgi:cytosine/adenosine deaminase-related metal-dependent hydrolase